MAPHCSDEARTAVGLKDRFTWYEKMLMRGGLVVLVGIGAFGMYRSAPRAAVGYLIFVALGGLAVMYDSVCVYCPYPFRHHDCLFYPYQLVAAVTTLRSGPIPWFRNAVAAAVFLGIVALPQYWLWGQWSLFLPFWALVLAAAIVAPLHFCRRCRHRRCPMNLVRLSPTTESGSL